MGEPQLEDEGSRESEDRSDRKVFFYVCEATFRLLRPPVGNSITGVRELTAYRSSGHLMQHLPQRIRLLESLS